MKPFLRGNQSLVDVFSNCNFRSVVKKINEMADDEDYEQGDIDDFADDDEMVDDADLEVPEDEADHVQLVEVRFLAI